MEIFTEHLKKNPFFSKIDARVKLCMSLLVIIMVLSSKGLIFPLFITCISLLFCIGLRIPLKVLLSRLYAPFFISFVVIILKFLFSGNDTIFSLEFLGLSLTGQRDGLKEGILISSRILSSVFILALLGFTTSFTDIIGALSWFKIPKGFVEILMFTHRYLFVLIEDALVIYNAQKNRLGYSSFRYGLKSFGILTGSMIIKAFDQSQTITQSMIQRGYDGKIPLFKQRPFNKSEILVSAMIIIAMGIIWRI